MNPTTATECPFPQVTINDIPKAARAVDFWSAVEHIKDAPTIKAREKRIQSVASKVEATTEDVEAAVASVAKARIFVMSQPDGGFFQLDADIPNPMYDRRVADRNIESVEVFTKDTTFTFHTGMAPRVKVFVGSRSFNITDANIVAAFVFNSHVAEVTTLRDAVRADDIEDIHFKEVIMMLLAEKAPLMSLSDVRDMIAQAKRMSEDEERALYVTNGMTSR